MEKSKKLGSILLVIGAILNVVPEMICTIISGLLMALGLFILFKKIFSKGAGITAIVFNGISFIISGYLLAVEVVYKKGNFKLGSFPMLPTVIISIVINIALIVFVIIGLKKASKND